MLVARMEHSRTLHEYSLQDTQVLWRVEVLQQPRIMEGQFRTNMNSGKPDLLKQPKHAVQSLCNSPLNRGETLPAPETAQRLKSTVK